MIDSAHLDAREIDRILKNENARWLSFSYDRLHRFGYAFDRY
jgi:mannose/fructose/N-acetylgalactosamine-specific phosphotransferase system component IID